MAKCNGQGFEACESCINGEYEPDLCDDCDDGSNWEGEDDSYEEMTIGGFKVWMMKEAA